MADSRPVATDFKTILKLRVPLHVELGHSQMPLSEVLALAPGALIELPQRADDELVLHASNRPIGTGSAIRDTLPIDRDIIIDTLEKAMVSAARRTGVSGPGTKP